MAAVCVDLTQHVLELCFGGVRGEMLEFAYLIDAHLCT